MRQLAVVRAAVRKPRPPADDWVDTSSGAPRPGPGRFVDGPGCTPVVVPDASPFDVVANMELRDDGRDEEEGEPLIKPLTGYDLFVAQKYAPAPEPADIPVRRLVDGKWQTVEVTLSDFRANEGADGRQPFRVKPDAVSVECLGDNCTGCSDPQCWTVRADGGDA